METLSDECVLSEYTMYFLCPGNEDAGWDEEGTAGLVSVFDTAQRDVVSDFLRSIEVGSRRCAARAKTSAPRRARAV